MGIGMLRKNIKVQNASKFYTKVLFESEYYKPRSSQTISTIFLITVKSHI
jgi:hypothetical protein